MNSSRMLRCHKDIVIYSHYEIPPLFSISFSILSNVLIPISRKKNQREKQREKERRRKDNGGRWEIGRTVDDRKLFEKQKKNKKIREENCLAQSPVEEMNFCHCQRINSLECGKVHLLKISINLDFLPTSHV